MFSKVASDFGPRDRRIGIEIDAVKGDMPVFGELLFQGRLFRLGAVVDDVDGLLAAVAVGVEPDVADPFSP